MSMIDVRETPVCFGAGNVTPRTPKDNLRQQLIGTWSERVDELNRSLTHEMHVSLFPNWLGDRQARLVQIDGDLLRLGTDTPMNFGGARKTAVLVWRRVEPNS